MGVEKASLSVSVEDGKNRVQNAPVSQALSKSLDSFPTPSLCLSVADSDLWYYESGSSAPAPGPMDSPSSISSYSSSSLSSSFSTSPVNSDSGFPSDNEREGKSTQGLRPDAVGQRGGSQPSPGPIRCRHRPRISSNQHTASHLEQRGSGIRRSRDGELETRLHTRGCTTEGDLLFAQKVREQETVAQWQTPDWWAATYVTAEKPLLVHPLVFVLFPTV